MIECSRPFFRRQNGCKNCEKYTTCNFPYKETEEDFKLDNKLKERLK